MANPKVFMDFKIGGFPAARVVFELFADITPIKAENFRALCTGEKGIGKNSGKPLHYKGSTCATFNYNDFIRFEGNGESIYGGGFEFENLLTKHAEPGILSMATLQGTQNTQNSRFLITMNAIPRYDGRCVAVGKVIDGMNVIDAIREAGYISSGGVIIADCGQLIDDDEDIEEPY